MRMFELHRDTDVSGVSGTGIVAQGIVFDDGVVALRWLGATASTVIHDNLENVNKIHGHGSSTRIVFIDPEVEVMDGGAP